MSLNPTATFAGYTTASATEFVGATTNLDIQFTNPTPGATEAGYQPYVAVELPPGVTWNGTASYLGNTVTATAVMLNGSGTAAYPFALTGGGTRPAITGTPGATVVVAELPYGSFVPGQTPVDLSIPVTLGSPAAPGAALAIKASGGFAYGNSATGANGVAQSTPSVDTLTPTVATVITVYNGPQGQAATGPTIQAQYGGAVPASSESITVNSDIAGGVSVANFGLSDALPNGAVPTEVLLTGTAGQKWYYTVSPTTGVMTLDTTLTSAGDQGTAPGITTASAAAGATAPYVYYDAASSKVVANFGTVVGTSTATGQNAGPSITTYFYEGPQQTLGHGVATAQTAGDITVVDNLPYQATTQSFQLTGPNGEVWKYSVSGTGTVSFVSGPAGAPSILSGAGAAGSSWVYFDKAAGKIVANFSGAMAGQSAAIDAATTGGQAQPQPGVISAAIDAGNNASVKLVDQLSGGAQANGFSVTIGANTYSYSIAGGVIAGVVGNGAGAPAAGAFSYDSSSGRISANLTNVNGGAMGSTVTLSASQSGGALVSAGGQAVAVMGQAGATGTFSLPTGSGNLNSLSASATVQVQDITVQKAAKPENPDVIPGSDIDYRITGQIGSAVDIHNIVVSDTLGDGQYFDTSAAPVLVITDGGVTKTIAFAPGDVVIGAQDAITGKTPVTFDVSKAMTDAGLSFSDFSVVGSDPANFTISYKSTVDTQYRADPTAANDPASYAADQAKYAPWVLNTALSSRILQGDYIDNAITTTGTLADGAVVSTGSNTQVQVPTPTLAKSILEVDNAAPVLNAAGAINANTGSLVTYELKEVLPVTNGTSVTLTDFLPLPVFQAAGFSFNPTYSGTVGPQTAGEITWAPGDTFHTLASGGPTISYDTVKNAVIMDFGMQPNLSSYATTTIDLLFTAPVLDKAFTQDLKLTNQVVGSETNSYGMTDSSQAIAQITLNAPQLKIEKGAVATTDALGQITGGLGGVTWNAPGSASAFTGTIDTSSLTTSPLNADISKLGAGDRVTFAVAVENLGSDPKGAFNVKLTDSLPNTIPLADVSNFRVVDGTGATLGFTGSAADFFNGTGITLNDPTPGTKGSLAAVDQTSGKNVAVVLYDVTLPAGVAIPDETITNTASIVSYTAADGTVNRATAAPAGYNTAQATLTTDAPTLVKSFVSASDGSTQDAVKIGATVTYDIAVTFPGGTAQNVSLSDLLPHSGSGELDLVSAALASKGSALSFVGGSPAPDPSGNVALGTVTAANNNRDASDTLHYTVVARAINNANNSGGDDLVNTAKLSETNPNGGAAITQTSTAEVELVAPKLMVDKSAVDLTRGGTVVQAGDTVEYTVVVHNAGDGKSYLNDISDLLNTQIGQYATLQAASVKATGTGPGTINVATGNTAGDTTVDVTDTEIDAGKSVTVIFDATVNASAKLGSTITNSATAEGYSLPALAGGGVNNNARLVSGSGSANLTVAQPANVKSVSSVSDSNLASPNVEVGETGTFDILVTVPAGLGHNLTVTDVLPTGLTNAWIVSETYGANISGPVGAVAAGVSGNTVTLNFGDVTDTRAVGAADSAADTIDIKLAGKVADVSSNQNGTPLTNSVSTAVTDGSGAVVTSAASTASLNVVQPVIAISKTDALTSAQKVGTVVPYSITLDPTAGTGPAYNVHVVDNLTADEVASNVVVKQGGMTLAGATPTISSDGHTIDLLLAGPVQPGSGPIVISYDGTIQNSATPGETIVNTASLTYDTQASGGRVLTPAAATASQTVAVLSQISKSVLSASDASIPLPNVAAGEAVTYQIVGTLDAGTQTLKIDDLLPAGQSFLSATVTHVGTDITGIAPGAAPTGTAGGDVVFNFGTVVSAADTSASADHTVVIDVTTLVRSTDTAATAQGDTATILTAAPGGGNAHSGSANSTVSLVAPQLTLSKATPIPAATAAVGPAGTVVTYTETIDQLAGMTGPAYNVTVADPLTPGLKLVKNSETITQGGATIGSVTETGTGFVANVASIGVGAAPVVITYQAILDDTVADGSVITNTATLDYTSQPKTAANGNTGGAAGAEVTASAAVKAHLVDQFSKTLVGTAFGAPMGGPPPLATVGETLTYDLVGTLDFGTQHLVLSDALPTGLDYVSSSVISLGNTTGSSLAVGASGSLDVMKHTVSFDFGATNGITEPAGSTDRTVVAQVVVKVDSAVVPSTPGHDTLTDTGSLVTSTPNNAPGGIAAGLNQVTLTSQQTVKIVPPSEIDGIVFLDGGCTATYHVGDAGVAGVTVQLYDGAGNFTGKTAITNDMGAYSFGLLPPGTYQVKVFKPTGTDFSEPEHASGDASVDSDVNPTTGFSDKLVLTGSGGIAYANAGLEFNGNFAGVTPVNLGNGGVDAYGQNGTYVGNGGAIYHVGGAGQTILALTGQGVTSIVEAGGGSGTNIVTSCGPINGQTQNAANGYMFAGPGGSSTLQGGSGNAYLVGNSSDDLITGGSGTNTLAGGTNDGQVFTSGGTVTGFSGGDELRVTGQGTTILFQKGDGVDKIDNGFRLGQDAVKIYGYSSGTIVVINSQAALYLGGNDLIYFNGGSPFKSGPITNGSIAGVSFDPTLPAPTQLTLTFPPSGQPTFSVPSGATPSLPAPISPPVPAGTKVVALGQNDHFTFGNTDTIVTAIGANQITGGSGNNTINLSGFNSMIMLTDGNNTVTTPADTTLSGNNTVQVGNGTNVVTLYGDNEKITAGSGHNTLTVVGNNGTVDTTSGNDVVTLNGMGDLVIGGTGQDFITGGTHVTYRANGTSGLLDITGFDLSSSVVDLSPVSTAGLSVVSTANDTQLVLGGSVLVDLHGIGGQSLSGLISHGNLKLV